MGRLFAALKRLEPEMPDTRGAESVASEEILPTVETGVDQTAVWEPPVQWREDLLTNDGLDNDSLYGESVCESTSCDHSFNCPTDEELDISQPVEMEGTSKQVTETFENASNDENTTEYDLSQEDLFDDRADDPHDDQESFGKDDALTSATESAENQPFVEISAELDLVGRLLDEELPVRSEIAAEATLLQPETENSQAKKDHGIFETMARNIMAQLPGEEAVALFFTSPTDGEGKTETILPLAEALIHQSGRRTILVDANLHRPDLTREWRFTSRRGIFDVLTGEADWWEAVQETGLPKLSILLNNGLPSQHAIVAQPLAFSELLQNLKREYRLVLIDAASLAHEESIPMVRHCQGVYLIVRLGHASPRTVREARQVIDQAGGKLLGCIAVGDVLAPTED